jgi:NAD(P)-dependent dehydrogenase (short-subunit alcohol dehydrogenase family)
MLSFVSLGGKVEGVGLRGRVAIVTGAGTRSPGIGNGKAAAVTLARAGARVAAIDLAAEYLQQTCELIHQSGGECLPLTADVADAAAAQAAVKAVGDAWGRVDVLVNNVGIGGPSGSVVDIDLGAWEECFRVNVTSMLLMSRFAIPHMRNGRGGSIINISSVVGLRGGHRSVAYSTTKGAIISLTRAMATEHGSEGIRVNAVAPGFVHTPHVVETYSEGAREKRRLAAPLQVEGTGWDVASAVLFYAGDLSRWITGTVLPVDAGLTASLGVTR